MRAMGNRSRFFAFLIFLLGSGTFTPPGLQGQGLEPAVHAVLFYSPTCPHCHALINDHLVPLQEEYGTRLVILAFDVTQSWASEIYWEALRQYEVPREDWVVPVLVLREEVLVGGDVIPVRLVEALEEGLSGDGIDLPNLPPLLTLLEEQGMLDPRYPERRIVLQAPVDQEAGEPEPPEAQPPSEPPADSVLSADETPATFQQTVDDPGAGEGDPTEPDSAGAEPVPAETGGGGEVGEPSDTLADDPSADPEVLGPEAAPADSAVSGGGPTTPTDPPGTPGEEPPSEEASAEAGAGADPPSGIEPGSGRPMDLSGAVEEMESMTMMDRFNQDRAGNSLSVFVLLVMLVSLMLKGYPPRTRGEPWQPWVIPTLVVLGIGVAAYLSYIEVTHAEAACGPVGDCNTVNQSKYATLFGVLPVGVLGLMGYGLILIFWIMGRVGPEASRGNADLALWVSAVFGTLFSIYLTFLEPFVIGATCAWCLSSALILTLLLWASAPLAALRWPASAEAGS